MKSPADVRAERSIPLDDTPVLRQVAAHVSTLLENLPDGMTYHTLEHTVDVVEAAQLIGRNSGLDGEQMELLLIAAWMHDIGYIRAYRNHEQEGGAMAADFLRGISYPEPKVQQVCDAIMATRVPQNPRTLVEDVLCDADLLHLAGREFFERGRLLRLEWEHVCNRIFSDFEWLRFTLDFVEGHVFHTTYAREQFNEQLEKNVKKLRKRIRKMLEEQPAASVPVAGTTNGKTHEQQEHKQVVNEMKEPKEPVKKEKEKKPERGIETMFKTTSRNHIDLSSIADQKANIMITTNALVISIVVSLLGRALDEHENLLIPTLILLSVCVTTIIFATISTRPTVTSGTFTSEDVRERKVNLLFFGNFHSVPLQDFEYGVREMMGDPEYLYGSMIKDIYFLGRVLGRKYRYLRICYSIFMYGLIVSVIAFGIAFIVGD